MTAMLALADCFGDMLPRACFVGWCQRRVKAIASCEVLEGSACRSHVYAATVPNAVRRVGGPRSARRSRRLCARRSSRKRSGQ
eukprot:7381479-Alexandrium_andersonii.AAC.1